MRRPIMLAVAVLGLFTVSGLLAMGNGEAQSDDTLPPTSRAEAASTTSFITVTDALGRDIRVPENPDHIICSGAGCLRLCVYLERQNRVIAVDDMETRRPKFDARPYAIANPWFKSLPTFGEFRGHDNPELIVALEPQPEVIFKTYPFMGTDPAELQAKTGIPVVTLSYGDLSSRKADLYASLRLMGRLLDAQQRASDVISFMEDTIADLSRRSQDVSQDMKPTCYVGGIAFKGPHGLRSTEPAYPPFMFVHARNVAYDPQTDATELQHANVAKESITMWDPDYIFVDVSTVQADSQASALYELQNDPAYTGLSAVRERRVFGVLPYNWYTRNFGSILANAYFLGSVLYPQRFADIEPEQKADEIYRFLVGDSVMEELNSSFGDLAFMRLSL